MAWRLRLSLSRPMSNVKLRPHYPVLEMPLVMDKFLFDVGKLGIELVLLGRPSGVQASI